MRSSEETMLIPSSRRNLNQEYLEYCQADLPHPVGNSGPEKRWQVLSTLCCRSASGWLGSVYEVACDRNTLP
jgi:hypothetical protein